MSTQQSRPPEQLTPSSLLNQVWEEERYRYALFGFVGGALTIAALELLLNLRLGTLLGGFIPELIGVVVTIKLIEELYNRRETAQRKRELVRQVANKNNRIAVNAVAELNEQGWLVGDEGALQKQDLSEANLESARFWYANMREARLWFTNLKFVEFWNADLTNAELVGVDLTGAKLVGANLQGADLSFATLTDTDWRNANLSGVDLTGFDLSGCNLMKADLTGTKLEETSLRKAKLWDARLIEAELTRADFTEADLSFVNATKSQADNAHFNEGNLRRTNFTQASLKDADFSGARMGGAYFNGADLTGANLEGAILIHRNEWDKLLEARFDEKTILPDGTHFDPKQGLEALVRFGCVIDPNADTEEPITSTARPVDLAATQESREDETVDSRETYDPLAEYDPSQRTLVEADMLPRRENQED
jgi:uncharacterized protein YjbI with pentapeptide repeats